MFVNAFHYGVACNADLASSEAFINEVSRGCIKTGKGERRGVEKKFSAPVSQKERGESRSWIPEQMVLYKNK